MRTLIPALIAVAGFLAPAGARAQTPATEAAHERAPSSAEVKAAQAMIRARPTFRDASGKPISEAAFTAAAKAGQRYTTKPDIAARTVVLQLLPPGVDTPGSQSFANAAGASPTTSVTVDAGAGGRMPAVFHDVHGHPITLQAFVAGAAQHQRYTMKVDPKAHKAVLTMLPIGATAPGSIPTSTLATVAAMDAGHGADNVIPAPGSAFPAFNLHKLGGGTLSAAQFAGHPYVVDFFFADCIGCIAELPELNAFHREHPQWPLVAVTFDDARTAAKFVRNRHFNWPVAYDGMPFDSKVGVKVYPTMVVVGSSGKVLATRVGAQTGTSSAVLQKWVARSVASASHGPLGG